MFVRFTFLLRLLVLELAVVEDAADGRVRVGRDLDQIEALFAGLCERLLNGDYAEFLPLVVDDEDFADPNPFVDAEIFSCYRAPLARVVRWWRTRRWASS